MALTQAAPWLGITAGDPLGLQTMPYGSYSAPHHLAQRRAGVAIGDRVLDLTAATDRLLPGRAHLFSSGRLDAFLAAGDQAWTQVRTAITAWLTED